MSVHIPAILARLVRKRAGNACEYCRLPQSSQEATFHVDHIRPASSAGCDRRGQSRAGLCHLFSAKGGADPSS